MSKTIKVKKYVDIVDQRDAAAPILPGMLVAITTAGTVQPHGVAAGRVLTAVALEDELQGKTINDGYVATDPVQIWYPQRGEQALMLLAAAQVVTVGANLVSAGNGALSVPTAPELGTASIVGQALEARTAPAGAMAFVKVLIY